MPTPTELFIGGAVLVLINLQLSRAIPLTTDQQQEPPPPSATRVGDGAPIIGDSNAEGSAAHILYEDSNCNSTSRGGNRVLFPDADRHRAPQQLLSPASSSPAATSTSTASSTMVGYPSESSEESNGALSYPASSNEEIDNGDDLPRETEQPALYFPGAASDGAGSGSSVDNSTVPPYGPMSPSTERPLRDTNHLLFPTMNQLGRPTCLQSPGDTFCENVSDYPRADLKEDISFSPGEFRELFGVKEIDGRKMYQDEDSGNEERVCRRMPKVIYPQMARNQAKQWVYIVNDVEYVQAVVSEVCEKENKPCAYLDHALPAGVYSRCRQKFAYRRLLAIHPTEKRTYTDTFQFPSCCACYVKSSLAFGRSKESRK